MVCQPAEGYDDPRSHSGGRAGGTDTVRNRSGLRDEGGSGPRGWTCRSPGPHVPLLRAAVSRPVRRGSRTLSEAAATVPHSHRPDSSDAGASTRPSPASPGTRILVGEVAGRGRRVHVPDAPGGAADRTGIVPTLWHGAGTRGDDRGGTGERRTRGHDAQVPRQSGDDHAGVPAGDERDAAGRCAASCSRRRRHLAAAGSGHAGGALGWRALLRSRMAVDRPPQPEHVHAHRARRGRGVSVQRGRNAATRPDSGVVSDGARRHPRLLRGGLGHRGPGPTGTGPRTARA